MKKINIDRIISENIDRYLDSNLINEGIGSFFGKTAGKAANFFSDMKDSYQQQRQQMSPNQDQNETGEQSVNPERGGDYGTIGYASSHHDNPEVKQAIFNNIIENGWIKSYDIVQKIAQKYHFTIPESYKEEMESLMGGNGQKITMVDTSGPENQNIDDDINSEDYQNAFANAGDINFVNDDDE